MLITDSLFDLDRVYRVYCWVSTTISVIGPVFAALKKESSVRYVGMIAAKCALWEWFFF